MNRQKTVDFYQEAQEHFNDMVAIRRDFHQHPEVGFQEHRTSRIVAQTLTNLGLEVQTGLGQTGVVGLLEGEEDGPTVLLRFDMDALPINEANQTDYVSKHAGVMHACGHDGHMAMGLTLAKIMSKHRPKIKGRLKFVFQPAEEGLGGAFAMIADGVLNNPKPDVAFAMHLWTPLPLGTVQVVPGPAMSASSIFTLTVRGRGGHGAAPHEAVDPILAAGHIITALQSIVSRNIDPQESAVISLGQIIGGRAHNVIPEEVIIRGTVRSYSNEVHHFLYRRILETSKSLATAFGCNVSLETIAIVAAVVNDAAAAHQVQLAAEEVVGVENIINKREMASEDMGYILEEIPGCYFFVGARNDEKGFNFPHHHPNFDFDEQAMLDGVTVMATAVSKYVMNGATPQ
ncbi:MAG: amidohydrolase [Anaerolineales bacterium]|nr:amidohydrolase [Anaerolineales bacterium]